SDLMFVNFGWGVLNLLPILPLDGGHITAGFEEIITKRQDMTTTMIISIITAIVLGIYGFAKGSIGLFGIEADGRFFAFFALLMALQNVNLLMHRSDTRTRPAVPPPREAPRKTTWNTAAKPNSRSGIEGAKKAVERARSAVERRQAMEMLVRAYVQSGDFPQARRELNNLESVFGTDPCLEGYYLLQSGQTERAIAHLKDAFAREPDPKVGNMLTHALLSEKRFEEALEWASDPSLSSYAASLFKTIQSDAYSSGQYELSARAGDLAFRKDRDPAAAYNVACALGRLSRIDEAVMWVGAALDAGFPDVSLLSLDPDMAPLKGHPEFQRLVKSKAS
ncbi:MAG: TPR end-of-group domain-containing protein, partial [Blastocatellia bacterium]